MYVLYDTTRCQTPMNLPKTTFFFMRKGYDKLEFFQKIINPSTKLHL